MGKRTVVDESLADELERTACVCGHSIEEHPDSHECVECDCMAFSADEDDLGEEEEDDFG